VTRSTVVALSLLPGMLPGVATAAQPVGRVVPVARTIDEAPVALAGERLLFSRRSRRNVRLLSAPTTGGRARTLFSTPAAPRRPSVLSDLDASSERVGFVLLKLNPGDRVARSAIWAGSPGGPFAPIVRRRGRAWLPVDVQVSGTAVAVTEIHPTREAFRHSVFPAGAPGVPVRAPRGVDRVDLAGNLVAFVDGARQLVVQDWLTGAERLRHVASGPIDNHDLAEDGRVLLQVPAKRVLELVCGRLRTRKRLFPVGAPLGRRLIHLDTVRRFRPQGVAQRISFEFDIVPVAAGAATR
jgi:hypothetical protein